MDETREKRIENTPILEVKNLKKYFSVPAGLVHAVDDISFSIDAGRTLGVVGESGCGKSTLGRVLIHLLESNAGQILFSGRDITHVDRQELTKLRKRMQMIFQDPYSSLNPRMSLYESIAEPLRIMGHDNSGQIQEKVYRIMDTVGLARRLVNSYPHELDGGRRQRIGIARALVIEPEFVVCDEPVSALDVSIQAQILNLMSDIQEERKLTYIFVTHDLSVVKYISNDILVMYLGQMVEKAPTKELFRHRLHPYTKALLSAVPLPDIRHRKQRIALKGELTSPIDPPPGCRFASRCPYAREICHSETPACEEVLPDHFAACHLVREINGLS